MSGRRVNWRRWNRVAGLVAVALAVVLHAALKRHLAGSLDAAAVFTLAGASAWPLAKVALLLLLRLLVVLVLPGALLAEAGMAAVGAWRAWKAGHEPVDASGPGGDA
jgi:hypothetical protein